MDLDELDKRCSWCKKVLLGWEFGEIIEAEIHFRQNFPHDWNKMPRVLLCDDCYHKARRNNGDEPPIGDDLDHPVPQ